jgi:hypothetical protein
VFVVMPWILSSQVARADQQNEPMQVAEQAAEEGGTCSHYLPTIGRTVDGPCEAAKKPEPPAKVEPPAPEATAPPAKVEPPPPAQAAKEPVPPQQLPREETGRAFMDAGYSTKLEGTIEQCRLDCEIDPKCKAFQFTKAAWTTCSLHSSASAETIGSSGATIGRR